MSLNHKTVIWAKVRREEKQAGEGWFDAGTVGLGLVGVWTYE